MKAVIYKTRIARFVIGIILTILLVCTAFVAANYQPSIGSGKLSDGSRVTIHSIQSGTEIEVVDGTVAEELLHSMLPRGGLHIGPFHFKGPSFERYSGSWGHDVLYLELDAEGNGAVRSKLETPSIYGEFRGLFVDESGFAYPQVFLDTDRVRKGDFGMFLCSSYPRMSRSLIFHIQQRDLGVENWRTLTTIRFNNPAPVLSPLWEHPIRTKVERNDWEFSIGDVTVSSHSKDQTNPQLPEVTIPLSVSQDERWKGSWRINRLIIEDQWGNSFFSAHRQDIAIPSAKIRGKGVPNPASLWKVQVEFGREADRPWGQSLTIRVPERVGEVEVHDFAGFPVTIIRETPERIRITTPVKGSDLALRVDGLSFDGGRRVVRSPLAFMPLATTTSEEEMSQVLWFPKERSKSTRLRFTITGLPFATFYVRPLLIME